MKINIEEIKKAPGKELEISFSDFINDLNLEKEAEAQLTAAASDYGVIISGNIKAKLVLQCDRCLNEYSYELAAEIKEEFVNEDIIPADQKEVELGENDFVVELKGNKEIDIKDLVYQSIILNLPYKNLCSANCPGLQEFQKNNYKNEEYIDERLEVFKTFSENKLSKKQEGLKNGCTKEKNWQMCPGS